VLAHPGLEFGDQWCCVFAAHREAVWTCNGFAPVT
jgi:uncharacterized protein (DUF2237 family)